MLWRNWSISAFVKELTRMPKDMYKNQIRDLIYFQIELEVIFLESSVLN